MTSATVNQLHLLQQNLQAIQQQKQQLEAQSIELDSALAELQKTSQAYTILGNLMVASSPAELIQKLEERQERTEIRIKNLSKQEEKLHQTMAALQQEVAKELKQKKSQ